MHERELVSVVVVLVLCLSITTTWYYCINYRVPCVMLHRCMHHAIQCAVVQCC
jgi:hypothetical protein